MARPRTRGLAGRQAAAESAASVATTATGGAGGGVVVVVVVVAVAGVVVVGGGTEAGAAHAASRAPSMPPNVPRSRSEPTWLPSAVSCEQVSVLGSTRSETCSAGFDARICRQDARGGLVANTLSSTRAKRLSRAPAM